MNRSDGMNRKPMTVLRWIVTVITPQAVPFRKLTGVMILVTVAMTALFAPLLAPHDPVATDIPYQLPSWRHLLGTNDLGRDVFSELIYASRVALAVGFVSGFLATFIGVIVGVPAGYFGGWVEEFLMGITDVLLLIPGLPLMIILAAHLTPSMWNIIAVISLLWWCPTARLVHARVLQVRGTPFIESTRALGYANLYIIRRHILVNVMELVHARFTLTAASAMVAEASLSFLGLGDPLTPSWGEMIHFAFSRGGFANDMWWWYLPPGLMISITVLGLLMLAKGCKKDPKLPGMI